MADCQLIRFLRRPVPEFIDTTMKLVRQRNYVIRNFLIPYLLAHHRHSSRLHFFFYVFARSKPCTVADKYVLPVRTGSLHTYMLNDGMIRMMQQRRWLKSHTTPEDVRGDRLLTIATCDSTPYHHYYIIVSIFFLHMRY